MTNRHLKTARWPGSKQGGFTLAEVMVASFVMLFSITSSVVTINYGFRFMDTARKTTLASQVMQSEMERIRMLSWGAINSFPENEKEEINFEESFPNTTDAEKAVLGTIKRTFTGIRVTTSLADYNNEIRQIDITITWKGLDGVRHTRSSSTQYCKDGLYAYYYTGI